MFVYKFSLHDRSAGTIVDTQVVFAHCKEQAHQVADKRRGVWRNDQEWRLTACQEIAPGILNSYFYT